MDQNDSKADVGEPGSTNEPKLSPNAGWLERTFGITSTAGKIGCMSPLLVPLLLIGYCSYRSAESNRADEAQARAEAAQGAVDELASNPAPYQPSKFAGPPLTDKQRTMVCKAGIAILMGRDPKTMTATPQGGGLTRIQYRRPDDNKLWKTDCRIDGSRFMWRGVDSFGDDGPGRWRDSADDEVITFAINGKKVTMTETFSDGSVVKETYRF